jgi:two-component system, OmpR family, sensor histidine kinase SenX3
VLAGLLLGAMASYLAIRATSGKHEASPLPPRALPGTLDEMAADTVLELLPTAAVLVDSDDRVRLANSAAVGMGIVKGPAVVVPEVAQLVRTARRTGITQTVDLSLESGGFPRRVLAIGAKAQPLDNGDVALVVDDLTESRRVESVRRDFVANVGHEIKTPVGALTLLAEAALEARDDPDAVQHFLTRMQREAQRLSRLVQELLDLSRLQGGEAQPEATEVSVDAVVEEAIDRARNVADAKRIQIVRGGDVGLVLSGNEPQLVTALSNLLDNAVAYSAEGTQVAVTIHLRGQAVELAVKDQGIGIAELDQERIFERFYRVDPARSRITGGAGLGLAIVKHIVGNHGGELTVWSQPGAGSTFTVKLPARPGGRQAMTEDREAAAP